MHPGHCIGWNTNGYKNFFDLIGSKFEIHSVVKVTTIHNQHFITFNSQNPIKPMQKHIINHGMLSYTEYRKSALFYLTIL